MSIGGYIVPSNYYGGAAHAATTSANASDCYIVTVFLATVTFYTIVFEIFSVWDRVITLDVRFLCINFMCSRDFELGCDQH